MPTKHKVMSIVVNEVRLQDYRELTVTTVSTSKIAALLNSALDTTGIKCCGVIEFDGDNTERIIKIIGTDNPEEAASIVKAAIRRAVAYNEKQATE